MNNVLITGASGLLGPYIAKAIKETNPKSQITGVYNSNKPMYQFDSIVQADITDELQLTTLPKADLIVHCAALTDHQKCEAEPELAKKINVQATEKLLKLAKESNATFVYISSESVFHNKTLAKETDTPNPQSVYAKTKLAAEKIVAAYPKAIIARTTIFGKNLNNGKGLFEQCTDALKEGRTIKALDDKTFTPITTTEFSKLLIQLSTTNKFGIYHIVSDQVTTRYALFQNMAKQLGYNPELIQPLHITDLPDQIQKVISRIATLDNTKIKQVINVNSISLDKQIMELNS